MIREEFTFLNQSRGTSRAATSDTGAPGAPFSGELRNIFNRHRNSHPATDAQGGDPVLRFALEHFMQQRDCDSRACAADGMSERNRSTVDVELVVIKVQLSIA